MPEPSASVRAGGRTCHPQPKPRLSLALNKNDPPDSPLYENIQIGCKAFQDLEKAEEAESNSDQTNNNENENMATSNQYQTKRGSGRISSVRRSTLPVAQPITTSSNIPVICRNATTLGKAVSTVGQPTIGNRTTVQHSFLHTSSSSTTTKVQSVQGSANSQSTQLSTIKCMPYNSPRLAKCSRFSSTNGAEQQNGHNSADVVDSKRMGTVVARTDKHSSVSLNGSGTKTVINKVESTVMIRPAYVPQFRKQPVSCKYRVPTLHRSMDRLLESSSLSCSADSLLGKENAVNAVSSIRNRSEYRKSASIPPQLVATLANQFNALIEHNQTAHHINKSNAKVSALVNARGGSQSCIATMVSSSTVAIRSCPSSPLNSSNLRPGRTQKPAVGNVNANGRPKSKFQSSGIPKCKGSVSSVDGNESSDTEASGKECSASKGKEILPLDARGNKLTIVQRAVRNYEVLSLTKCTSSPELPRKKIDSVVDLVPSVTRQSQTLPTATVQPSYNLIRSNGQSGDVHTLPHLDWSAKPPYGRFTKVPAVYNATTSIPSYAKEHGKGNNVTVSCKAAPLPNTSGLILPNKSVEMKPSINMKTAGPPLPQQRTFVLENKKNGLNAIYTNTPRAFRKSDHPCSENAARNSDDPNLFHARPAKVVDKIQVRKLPEIPTGDKDTLLTKHESGNPITCIMRSSLRRKAIFEKRCVPSSGYGSSADGCDSDHSSDSKCSMDLLAEIDNHPRILAAVESATKLRSNFSTQQTTDSIVEVPVVKAPNASFLWKSSTQDKVSQEFSNPPTFTNFPDGTVDEIDAGNEGINNEPNQLCYEDDEEHLYEELANCISRSIPSPPPHHNIPLPLPELDEDSLIENVKPHEVNSYCMARNSLESHTSSSYEKMPDDSPDCSDASWTDDSDANAADEIQLRNKVKQKGKRPANRKHLSRRSWSQSLRDLVGSQDNSAKQNGDVIGCWEDEFGSDGSMEQVYNGSDPKNKTKENGPKTSSVTTDTDSDKSPTSGNGGSTSDVNQPDAEGRESKGKRVKRNWSWSKTDFHLDLTSKLGKIRMKKKTTTEICVETSSIDTSPTKKKQWPFKGKAAAKKGGQRAASPKQSPRRESAQFYVPTFNSDGSLASPPGHMANLDIQAQASIASYTGSNVSLASSQESCIYGRTDVGTNSNAAMKRTRRISSGGTLTRPKTAPPAPPISTIKFAPSTSPSIQNQVYAPCSTSSEMSSDGTNEPDCISSQVHKPVENSNSNRSESSHTKYSSIAHIKIGSSITCSTSNISSDSELMASVVNKPKTRESVASNYSGSSEECCIRMEDVPTAPGAHGELMSRFLQTRPTIPESESDGSTLGSGHRGFLYLDDTYYIDNYRNSKLSPFEDEPLYQFYNINAQQRAAQENQVEGSDDDYESLYHAASEASSTETVTSIPSAMDLVKSTEGGVRTLWCEVPEVISSGILETISPQERKLQEAMFEVITSEASYLKSLNVLINVFMTNPLFMDDYSIDCVLNKREKHVLFSDVLPVHKTSERLLAALEKQWQENVLLSDICDILQDHATKYFDVYVKYCSNQIYQDRCLKTLKETNPQFVELLRVLEMRSECQSLSMHSFLMLPMQRITRLPLLVDAIFNRLDHGTKQYESCKQALMTLNKIVHECNEGAARMARMEEMLNISRLLDFREFKGIALISASRWLVKKGDLTRLLFCDPTKLSFGRRCTKQIVYLFLFTDLLIITKKKSDDCYNVVDYCPRNMVQVTEIESFDQLPDRPPDGCKNVFQLSMLQNHDNRTVEMFFCCPVESDRTRWMEAVTPKKSENPDERIYEEWDCPQVQAIHNYVAQQPDELSLEESDVVNVFRKTADGWYQGERIRDGIEGWFPSNYTVEIVSSHVRARNLRQRYRLLALSHSYLEEQKKKIK